jgi:hypothetical protein
MAMECPLWDVDFAVTTAPSLPFSYSFAPVTPATRGKVGGASAGDWQVYQEWNGGGYRLSLLGVLVDPNADEESPRPFEGIGGCATGTSTAFQESLACDDKYFTVSTSTSVSPEPGTGGCIVIGLAGIAAFRRRTKR